MRKSCFKTGILAAGAAAFLLWRRREQRRLKSLRAANQKLSDNYLLLHHWLEIKNEGRSVAEYLLSKGCRRIGVYGMGDLANRLAEELEDSGVQIMYGIDRDISCTHARIRELYSPEQELPSADAIIVTPYEAFESIRSCLEKKTDCPILSIEEMVWSV